MKYDKAILILCVLPFLVLLAACGSDSSGSSDRDASLVGDWSRAENDSLWGVKMSSGGDFTFFIVDSSSTGYRYYREVGSWTTEGSTLFIALDRCEMSYTGASWTSSDEDCGNREASYALEDSILVIYTGDNTLYFVKGRSGILPDSLRSEIELSSAQETSSSSGAVAVFSSSSLVAYSYGEIPDSRDGQVYKTVTIGTQTWMAKNLNYADSIAMPNLAGNSWCYENSADNCAKYGRLYTWTGAMDIESS
ncbi:MAG: hypothetical protein M0P13_06880, partial [Fibrobacteraceae bacterium]|nr:hypothetical protein [Fibrobacteraceae bacterium]